MPLLISIDKAKAHDPRLKLDDTSDYVTFNVSGKDWINIHIVPADGQTAWPASAVLAVQVSLDGAYFKDFPAGAETITTYAANDLFVVTGWEYVKVYPTTAGGSTVYVKVLATAGVLNG